MAAPPSLIGQNISHYRILVRLGEGGMGVVYRAVDESLKREVALKFLSENLSSEETALFRLQREAEVASKLNHPNICTIYEISAEGGRVFIAMELIQGNSLKRHISGPLLSITETLAIAIQIADALDAAHESGVIHRDIKPANIMITSRGLAKVLDFGLAKIQRTTNTTIVSSIDEPTIPDSERLTRIDGVLGTAAYMSPEQARGEELDIRTDLFSLGILLYEMSTGSQPFRGSSTSGILHAIMEELPTQVRQLNPDIPPELERIINKALEKDRKLRYQRASEIRTDLQRLERERELGLVDANSHIKRPIASTRVLEAAAPKESSVGRATEIVTVIRLPDSEGLRKIIREERMEPLTSDDVQAKNCLLSFPLDLNGNPQPAEMVLRLDSPNFEPRIQSKKLKVPPKHDSEICTFLLTPLLSGELVVNLELLEGDQLVVSRLIRTRAQPEGKSCSSERVVVCLPLYLIIDSSTAMVGNQVRAELNEPTPGLAPTSQPKSGPKSKKLARGLALAFVALAVIFTAVFFTNLGTLLKPVGTREAVIPAPGPNTSHPDASEPRASPPPPMSEVSGPINNLEPGPEPESREIRDLVVQFSSAFSDKSISELEKIWPQIGDEKKDIETQFHLAESISRLLLVETMTFSADKQVATVSGSYRDTITSKGTVRDSYGVFHLKLIKANGKWIIVRANFAPQ